MVNEGASTPVCVDLTLAATYTLGCDLTVNLGTMDGDRAGEYPLKLLGARVLPI